MQGRQEGRSETWCISRAILVASPDHPDKKTNRIIAGFTSGLSGQVACVYENFDSFVRSKVLTTYPTGQAPLSLTLRSSFSVLRLFLPLLHSTRVQLSRERDLYCRTDLQTLQSPFKSTKPRVWGNPLGPQHDGRKEHSKNLKETQVGMVFHLLRLPRTNTNDC